MCGVTINIVIVRHKTWTFGFLSISLFYRTHHHKKGILRKCFLVNCIFSWGVSSCSLNTVALWWAMWFRIFLTNRWLKPGFSTYFCFIDLLVDTKQMLWGFEPTTENWLCNVCGWRGIVKKISNEKERNKARQKLLRCWRTMSENGYYCIMVNYWRSEAYWCEGDDWHGANHKTCLRTAAKKVLLFV